MTMYHPHHVSCIKHLTRLMTSIGLIELTDVRRNVNLSCVRLGYSSYWKSHNSGQTRDLSVDSVVRLSRQRVTKRNTQEIYMTANIQDGLIVTSVVRYSQLITY